MEIGSLAGVGWDVLSAAFNAAFRDYAVAMAMTPAALAHMQIRRGYVAKGIAAIAHSQCRRARDRHRGISRCRRCGPHGAPARDGAGAVTRPMASDCSPLRIDSRSN